MASPTIVDTTISSNGTASTSFSIDTGSPLQGEGVIIVLSRNSGSGQIDLWSDDYIELFSFNDSDGFASGAAAYIQAGGSEPSSITVTSSTSDEFVAVCFRISGHLDFDTQAPDFDTLVSGGNTATHDPPNVSVTGGSADILALAVLPYDTHNAGVSTYPTSYIGTNKTQSAMSGSQCSIAYGNRSLSAVSSEDPSAFVLSTSRRGIPATILIQEAGADSGLPIGTLSLLGVGK